MPYFSQQSKDRLATCHQDLQLVFNEVIRHFDCKVLEGHRDEATQNKLFYATPPRTQVKFPDSSHNSMPSRAVDVMPYPIDWGDRERCHYFAGFVLGVAASMGIKIRWGGDWDRDTEVDDNRFDDLPHFELV